MSRTTKTVLVGAAIAGLTATTVAAGCCITRDRSGNAGNAMSFSHSAEKHVCKGWNSCKDMGASGKNACKGHGDCATIKNECKGSNECKGLGGCDMGDNGCYGKNECKGKGGCKVPNMKHARKN